jgi:hypothetical protein
VIVQGGQKVTTMTEVYYEFSRSFTAILRMKNSISYDTRSIFYKIFRGTKPGYITSAETSLWRIFIALYVNTSAVQYKKYLINYLSYE